MNDTISDVDFDDTDTDIKSDVNEVHIKTKDGESVFNVLRIDTPNKWKEAREIERKYTWKVGSKNINMHLTGISYGKWSEIEENAPMPDRPDSDSDDKVVDEYNEKMERQLLRKRILVLEAATGFEIPGKSIEEKEEWIKRKGENDLEVLFNYIQSSVCCTENGEVENDYMTALIESDLLENSIVDMKSFDDWEDASNTEHIFRFSRPEEDFIIEIPLKGISKEVRKRIESETKDPLPPKVPKRDKRTRRIDPKLPLEYNYNDPGWIKNVQAMAKKRLVLMVSACLTFDIPGNSINEKYTWLSDRLLGDVVKLRNFIRSDLVGFSEYRDFF